VSAQEMKCLIKLPCLTSLDTLDLKPSAYPYLPQMKSLRQLRINGHDENPRTLEMSIADNKLDMYLGQCLLLEELTVYNSTFCVYNYKIVRALPHLKSLHLSYCILPNDFSFLKHIPELTNFEIDFFKRNEDVDNLSLFSSLKYVPKLSKLKIKGGIQFSKDQMTSLTPPSTILPYLKVCHLNTNQFS